MVTDLNIIILLSAVSGLLIAFYIWHKKTYQEHLICPIGSDCDTVVHSEYSRFFGIPVELLGIFYYALVAISYSLIILGAITIPPPFLLFIVAASLVAFLFSIYLTFIQLFSLKQICTWCLISAGISTLIFFLSITTSPLGIVSILAEYKQLIILAHFLGVALGVGGASIADIFFFKFLKDSRISESEADVMSTLSQVIWFALGLLVITGIGLYLPETDSLNESPKFLVKMIVVAVIIMNGSLLNLLIAPKMVKISFGEKHKHKTGELHHERKLAFALGAISIVSWYSAFLLGMFHSVPLSFAQLLSLYLAMLTVAVISSQIFEYLVEKRARVN